jgi:photosystem II stability/assembly factor-like uncharacterized protein
MTESSLMSIAFANDTLGVAVGLSGTIITTLDGGETWELLEHANTGHLYNVVWQDNHFIVAGEGGHVLTSNDGKQWQSHPLGQGANWYTGLATKGETIYLSGGNLAKLDKQQFHIYQNNQRAH